MQDDVAVDSYATCGENVVDGDEDDAEGGVEEEDEDNFEKDLGDGIVLVRDWGEILCKGGKWESEECVDEGFQRGGENGWRGRTVDEGWHRRFCWG